MRTPVPADPTVDKILVALHKRPNATTEFLGAITRAGTLSVVSVLTSMMERDLICKPQGADAAGATTQWLLTQNGGKTAIFAIHRERATAPRTVFVGGVNPWTGEPMRC